MRPLVRVLTAEESAAERASAVAAARDAVHGDWCHWGEGCCGCKCGAVPFMYARDLDPSIEDA